MKNKILTVVLSVTLAFVIVFASFGVLAENNLQIGDVNGDGTINLTDVTHLAQYVAGWDVELGKGTTSDTPQPTGINFNNDNEANIYQNAPEADVDILMWRNWHTSEQKMINDYQMLTGVKINTIVTSEAEYATKLVSMISSGNAPDIVMFYTKSFPNLPVKALQPLDDQKFDLDADCWNKAYMDAFKVNSKYFGVAMPKTWNCEDGTHVTYYSPELLLNCGVTVTPYELYKQGKWNWETQNEIVRKVRNRGYYGLGLFSTDLFMHSAGVDFVSYDGSQYTNNLGSLTETSLLSQAWMKVSELYMDDCLYSTDMISNFQQKKLGLLTGTCYGLYNEGAWFAPLFAENLEIVPVAGPKGSAAYTPISTKVWGVPKGAENVDGAAYFLRYFLDVSNYNHDSTFYNYQFKEVFEIVTSPTAKKSVMYGSGVTDHVEAGAYKSICNALMVTTPSNITVQLNSKKGAVQTGVSRANKDLARF